MKWEDLQSQLKEPHEKELEQLAYSIPCTDEDSAEMILRCDMQEMPPDILITNYSMLNIMTMRSSEKDIFSKNVLKSRTNVQKQKSIFVIN